MKKIHVEKTVCVTGAVFCLIVCVYSNMRLESFFELFDQCLGGRGELSGYERTMLFTALIFPWKLFVIAGGAVLIPACMNWRHSNNFRKFLIAYFLLVGFMHYFVCQEAISHISLRKVRSFLYEIKTVPVPLVSKKSAESTKAKNEPVKTGD